MKFLNRKLSEEATIHKKEIQTKEKDQWMRVTTRNK